MSFSVDMGPVDLLKVSGDYWPWAKEVDHQVRSHDDFSLFGVEYDRFIQSSAGVNYLRASFLKNKASPKSFGRRLGNLFLQPLQVDRILQKDCPKFDEWLGNVKSSILNNPKITYVLRFNGVVDPEQDFESYVSKTLDDPSVRQLVSFDVLEAALVSQECYSKKLPLLLFCFLNDRDTSRVIEDVVLACWGFMSNANEPITIQTAGFCLGVFSGSMLLKALISLELINAFGFEFFVSLLRLELFSLAVILLVFTLPFIRDPSYEVLNNSNLRVFTCQFWK